MNDYYDQLLAETKSERDTLLSIPFINTGGVVSSRCRVISLFWNRHTTMSSIPRHC